MALFGSDPKAEAAVQRNPIQRHNRNNVQTTLRLAVIGYVGWMIFQIVKGYWEGDRSVTFPILVLTVLVFGAAIIALVIVSLRQWKQEEEDIKALCAQLEAEDALESECDINSELDYGDRDTAADDEPTQ